MVNSGRSPWIKSGFKKSPGKASSGLTHFFNFLNWLIYSSTELAPCLISKSSFCHRAFCLGVLKRSLKRCLKLVAWLLLSLKVVGAFAREEYQSKAILFKYTGTSSNL